MASYRAGRVNSEFQKAITALLREIRDPRLTDMVTVTAADISGDLKNGKVFLSIYTDDPQRKQANLAAVTDSAGFIRRGLARMIPHIRQIPQLRYLIDDSAEYGDKIDKLLNEINKAKPE
jgi:ribosome-binding factor A